MGGIAPQIGGGGADKSLEELLIAGHGLQTWNFPPQLAANTNALTTQLIYAIPVPYRVGQTVTNIDFAVAIASSGTSPTGVFVGIADSTGKLLAQSANLAATAFTATGVKDLPLSAPYIIPADGFYYHLVLVNGTWSVTQPTLNRSTALASFTLPNGKFIAATGGSGQTALPANGSSVTLAATSALAFFTASTQVSVYARVYSSWQDYPSLTTLITAAWLTNVDDALTGAKSLALNGGGFTNSYDTALWIAPPRKTAPTNNSQGLYIQHRVAGDLGGLVHDAGASELRLQGASNGGTGQNAFEASLVVSGGTNLVASANGVLSNFHTENTPDGSFTSVALFRASAIPALTGAFSIGTAYGLYLEQQTVAATNYALYVAGGNSVIGGQVVPASTSAAGVIVRGLASQGTSQPMFAVQNSTPTTLFQILVNGTGGFGGSVSNAAFWINNNIASDGTTGLVLKAKSTGTADLQRWTDSSNVTWGRIDKSGYVVTAKTSAPADADLNSSELAFWVDATPGATKAMFKAKDSGGTVRTGSVSLA